MKQKNSAVKGANTVSRVRRLQREIATLEHHKKFNLEMQKHDPYKSDQKPLKKAGFELVLDLAAAKAELAGLTGKGLESKFRRLRGEVEAIVEAIDHQKGMLDHMPLEPSEKKEVLAELAELRADRDQAMRDIDQVESMLSWEAYGRNREAKAALSLADGIAKGAPKSSLKLINQINRAKEKLGIAI